jgi:hypothetical protein
MSGTVLQEVGQTKRAVQLESNRTFKDLEEEALKLSKESDATHTAMAEVLFDIYTRFDVPEEEQKKVVEETGHKTFDEWSEAKLGWSPRKSYYMVATWRHLYIEAGLTRAMIAAVAWSKAKELVPLAKRGKLDKDNAKEWVEKAKKMTTEELKAAVKNATKKRAGAEDVEAVFRKTIGFYKPQIDLLTAACDVAEKISGSTKECEQIAVICTEFLAAHRKQDDRETGLAKLLGQIEESCKIKLIAFDAKAKEVVYGQAEVDALAKEDAAEAKAAEKAEEKKG